MTRPIGSSLRPALMAGLQIALLAGGLRTPALASTPDASWRPRWQVACRADGSEGSDHGQAVMPVACGPLVLWNAGRSIHAVRIEDGRHPWLTAPKTSLVFPRGSRFPRADQSNALPPLAVAVVRHRAVAILDGLTEPDGLTGPDAAGERSLLVCLDMSAAAEGRLIWQAVPPTVLDERGKLRETLFDGPPAADGELVCCVVRSRMPADWLAVVAFDIRDGRPLWSRPLGFAIDGDGIDHARRSRVACLAEDRVVVATHAGMAAAFDRDGGPAWRTELPTAGKRHPASHAPGPPTGLVAHAGDRIVVVPADRPGVLALDVQSGRVVWNHTADPKPRLVAVSPHTVIISTKPADDSGTTLDLVAIATADGNLLSRRSIGHSALADPGSGLIKGPRLFLPTLTAAGTWSLHSLDAALLQDRSAAEDLSSLFSSRPAPGSLSLGAIADSLLIASDGMMICCDPSADETTPRIIDR